MSAASSRRCGPALRALTGHEFYRVTANGTMALAGALAAVCGEATTADLPALGCWTLTQAAVEAGLGVAYHDVNRRLQGEFRASDRPRVQVVPWWGRLGVETPPDPMTVVDLSVNCGPAPSGVGAACVISMGPGKPAAHPLHGGVLAFSHQEIGARIDHLVSLADEHGRWSRFGPRLTELPISDSDLEQHFAAVQRDSPAERARVASAVATLVERGFAMDPVWPEPTGRSCFVPFLVPRSLGVRAQDVARLAVAWRVPLGTQPVAPAYLEPATSRLSAVAKTMRCSTAEDIATRLVFVPTSSLVDEPGAVDRLTRFSQWLEDRVAASRS